MVTKQDVITMCAWKSNPRQCKKKYCYHWWNMFNRLTQITGLDVSIYVGVDLD